MKSQGYCVDKKTGYLYCYIAWGNELEGFEDKTKTIEEAEAWLFKRVLCYIGYKNSILRYFNKSHCVKTISPNKILVVLEESNIRQYSSIENFLKDFDIKIWSIVKAFILRGGLRC